MHLKNQLQFQHFWILMVFFDFIWLFISFPVRKFWKKISFLCCILADISVSNLVSGAQYTVTNAICCKISLMYNSLVCRIIVLRIFVSWMCECVTKNKIKSIVVSKADYSCIWFLNSGIITTKYPKNHTHKISAQSFQRFWRSCVFKIWVQ